MTATIELDDDVIAEAAQSFFASEWADAREEAGFSFPPGTEITEVCPKQPIVKLLERVRPYVADLTKCWGRSVGEMFTLMEIDESDWAEALYYVLMGCRGHGVGLEDDFDENIEIAKAKLGIEIDPSPFYSEFLKFADLAFEVVEAEALTPDAEPDSDDEFQPGDRVQIENAHMPTGETLRGTGTVVRSTQDGVIVTMDDDDNEAQFYAGRTVFVDADECEQME
jgi:hypothetical protein